MREVVSLLREAGFEVIKAYYSTVNDLAFIDPRGVPKSLKLQRPEKDCFKETYRAKNLKAPGIPHSKAKSKSKTVNIGRSNKGSKTNSTSTREMETATSMISTKERASHIQLLERIAGVMLEKT